MRYVGSKRRIAKDILSLMLDYNKGTFVEPFCGGCNVTQLVRGRRIANDSHYYLIEMWKATQRGWIPPKHVSEEEYSLIKNNKEDYPPELVGYVGFSSFGSKWFGGYPRDRVGIRNHWDEFYRAMVKQIPRLSGVEFFNLDYKELEIPKNALLYCDPPYRKTLGYGQDFNHDEFYDWVRRLPNIVFISEYEMPDDFFGVWSKDILTTINTNNQKATERLFCNRAIKKKEVSLL